MAQTTGSLSMKDCSVAYTTDGTNYNDFSGYAGSVTITGGERTANEFYTFDGVGPIVTLGKQEPLEITVTTIYTEETTGPYLILLPYWNAGSSVGLRWSPRGLVSTTTGELVYTTGFAYSRIRQLGYPSGEANAAEPITMEMVIRASAVTTSTSTS